MPFVCLLTLFLPPNFLKTVFIIRNFTMTLLFSSSNPYFPLHQHDFHSCIDITQLACCVISVSKDHKSSVLRARTDVDDGDTRALRVFSLLAIVSLLCCAIVSLSCCSRKRLRNGDKLSMSYTELTLHARQSKNGLITHLRCRCDRGRYGGCCRHVDNAELLLIKDRLQALGQVRLVALYVQISAGQLCLQLGHLAQRERG